MADRYVIKVGGSLYDILADVTAEIRSSAAEVLIVPGGGQFAELARGYGAGDDESHWMAIAGMEQYGWYISSFGFPVTERLVMPPVQTVFLPYRTMRNEDPLPHSWDVTSDTIAAWTAWRLGMKLVLLKSVDFITARGRPVEQAVEPVGCSEVDPCLIPFVTRNRVPVRLINGRIRGRLSAFLDGRQVPGTVIGTTF